MLWGCGREWVGGGGCLHCVSIEYTTRLIHPSLTTQDSRYLGPAAAAAAAAAAVVAAAVPVSWAVGGGKALEGPIASLQTHGCGSSIRHCRRLLKSAVVADNGR